MSEKKPSNEENRGALDKNPLNRNEKRMAGLFSDLEKMEKVLDEIMSNLEPSAEKQDGNYKLDFSMTIAPNGEVVVEGNNRKKAIPPQFREPLVEVFDQQETFLVTAEMPGVEEKDLQIMPLENKAIEIIASGEKKFYKLVNFSLPIKGLSNKKFKNGILELKIEKEKNPFQKS
ncbi:MAG: hypothetical protein PHH08_03045 [Candidatus ainarchaeum sp.]|nr:hypothetical protein [Candidatus ainarchaeum sp.]